MKKLLKNLKVIKITGTIDLNVRVIDGDETKPNENDINKLITNTDLGLVEQTDEDFLRNRLNVLNKTEFTPSDVDFAEIIQENHNLFRVWVSATQIGKFTGVVKVFLQTTPTKKNFLNIVIKDANKALAENINHNEIAEAKLTEQIGKALAVFDDVEATQKAVWDITGETTNARKAFLEATKTDYTKLENAILLADEILANRENINKYPQQSAILQTITETARSIVEKKDTTQKAVDNQLNLMNALIDFFDNAE